VKYVNVNPAVLPVVTAAAVMSTVAGEHTAAGFVTTTVGFGLMVTTTGLISEHPVASVPFI
jgi:hypothetical protein